MCSILQVFKTMILTATLTGSLDVDEHHLTDGQLLGKAREFYASHSRFPL